MSDAGYRPAVGVMLINGARKVWVGQRLDNSLEAWQMPQGGIEKYEPPRIAALRAGSGSGAPSKACRVVETRLIRVL